jgi:protein phosphatase
MGIHAFGLSDVGRRRQANEDSFLVDPERGLFAVADGMGGHAAGEVASRLAIEAVSDSIDAGGDDVWRDAESLLAAAQGAVQAANQKIAEAISSSVQLRGMGTTLVAALSRGEDLVVAHVGDSRAYLLRGGTIRRLTRDHSWVNEQVQLGVLSEEEASRHPFRNVITRALGGSEPVPVDAVATSLEEGDMVLLCTDGLNGMVSDSDILGLVQTAGDDLEGAVTRLVAAANTAGGEDNVTVVLLCRGGP